MRIKKFNMKRIKLIFGIAAAASLVTGGCKTGSKNEETVLKFNLQNGKTYAYKMVMDLNSEAQGQKVQTAMNFDYDIAVAGDSAGVKTLKTTYKHMAMNMKLPTGEMTVDSDKPADKNADLQSNPSAVMGKMFAAMVGKIFVMKVDPEGKVTQISGLDEIADAMVESMNVGEDVKPRIRQMFAAQFNETNLKQTFSQAFNIFPNKPVKQGDKWEKTVNMQGMMKAEMKTTYTVKDISKDKVTLDAASTMEMAGSKVNQSGTMNIDPATGLVTDATLEQNMTGNVNGKTTIKISGKEM